MSAINTAKGNTRDNKRIAYYDLMRIVAIFLVIFNHLPGYTLYQISSGPIQAVYMSITMLTRINVPVFFMIAGALLLGKKAEQIAVVLRKRVVRFALIIALFDTLSYACYCIAQGVSFDTNECIHGVISGDLANTASFWFLYAYLGFLFMLPFLRAVVNNITKQGMALLIILHLILGAVLPIANIGFNYVGIGGFKASGNFSIPLALSKAFFYPLFGYYLDKKLNVSSLSLRNNLLLFLLVVMSILVSCLCTYWEGMTTGKYTQNYVELFDWLIAAVAFIYMKELIMRSSSGKLKRWIEKVCCLVGPLTFGMYLFDPCLKVFIYDNYQLYVGSFMPTMISSIGWVVLSMFLGGVITYALRKIPCFRGLI